MQENPGMPVRFNTRIRLGKLMVARMALNQSFLDAGCQLLLPGEALSPPLTFPLPRPSEGPLYQPSSPLPTPLSQAPSWCQRNKRWYVTCPRDLLPAPQQVPRPSRHPTFPGYPDGDRSQHRAFSPRGRGRQHTTGRPATCSLELSSEIST